MKIDHKREDAALSQQVVAQNLAYQAAGKEVVTHSAAARQYENERFAMQAPEGVIDNLGDYQVRAAKRKLLKNKGDLNPSEQRDFDDNNEQRGAMLDYLHTQGFEDVKWDAEIKVAFTALAEKAAGLAKLEAAAYKATDASTKQWEESKMRLETLSLAAPEMKESQRGEMKDLRVLEDDKNKKNMAALDLEMEEARVSKLEQLAGEKKQKASDNLKDFAQSDSRGSSKKSHDAMSRLLASAIDDAPMLAKIKAKAQGDSVKFSDKQRDKYGEDWQDARRLSPAMRSEVVDVSASMLDARSANSRAKRAAGRWMTNRSATRSSHRRRRSA